jgi:potassium efflux system protein
LLLASNAAVAAPDPASVAAPAETAIEPTKAVDAAGELAPEVKAKLNDLARQTAEEARLAAERQTKADEFAKASANVAARLTMLRCELDEPAETQGEIFPQSATAAELEQQLTTAEAALATERKKLSDLDNEPKRRSLRRVEISKLLPAATAKLAELDAQIAGSEPAPISPAEDTHTAKTDPPAVSPAPLVAAQQKLRESRRQALAAELKLYEQELAYYDASTGELLTLERDVRAQIVAQLERRVALLRTEVADARRDETERQAREARRAAAVAEPAVRLLAERNQQLADERKALANRIESVSLESDAVARQLKLIVADHQAVVEKEKAAGLTNAIGQLLRKKRAELPDLRTLRRQNAERQQEIARVQLWQFDLEDRRRNLSDLESAVKSTLVQLSPTSGVAEEDLRPLLQTERDYLSSLLSDCDAYFNRLFALDEAERKLIRETEAFIQHIDERVLWIRSAPALGLDDVWTWWDAGRWLTRADHWRAAGQAVWDALVYAPFTQVALLAAVAVLIGLSRRLRQTITSVGKRANRLYMPTIGPTFQAIAATVLLSIGWPAVIFYFGSVLQWSVDEFAAALGGGLVVAAGVYLPLELTRQSLRTFGLAEAHFRWPRAPLAAVRSRLRWLMIGGLPLVLLVAVLQEQTNDSLRDSCARFGFVALMIGLAIAVHRIGQLTYNAAAPAATNQKAVLARRFQTVWRLLLTAAPVALAALAAVGYYYTAVKLTQRIQSTIWLIAGIVVVHAVLVRCLRVTQRRLENRAAAERDGDVAENSVPGEGGAVPLEPPVVDLGTLSLQTQRLLHSVSMLAFVLGAGWIWMDVLPAFGFLDRIQLWRDAERAIPTTLADLTISLIITVMTVIAARNVPALLEIAVLQQLPLEAAARFAISTVSRYLIVLIGVVSACAAVGVGWSKVQWLVAAVTFGLGFGLQEIFANFISGLIVLFERPMRVGDVVTVGEVSGVVSRIRMRATTITDWDRKELIVPNKEFITGRLVNWTLSDRILRIVFRVGVAYGSDPSLVQRLLLKAGADHPSVLADPTPQALFVAFGDSTLSFELRVYVPGLEVYGAVQHELNTAIDRLFRESGIEIAFPQCDVHVRSIDAALPIARTGPRAFVGDTGARETRHAATA